jgi:hypothetical protein
MPETPQQAPDLTDVSFAVASLIVTSSGSRPPPKVSTIVNEFLGAQDETRWKILLCLVLDLMRKSAYVLPAVEKVAEALRDGNVPLSGQPINDLTKKVYDNELALKEFEVDHDWSGLLEELVTIIDEHKSVENAILRQGLIDHFRS